MMSIRHCYFVFRDLVNFIYFFLPKAPKIEADQNISDTAAGSACRAPHFPYF